MVDTRPENWNYIRDETGSVYKIILIEHNLIIILIYNIFTFILHAWFYPSMQK